jgi:hypothetical protein
MILFAIAIAKKHNRVTAETYRLVVVIWSIAVLTLGLGFDWSSHQMEQTLGPFENVKTKAEALQKYIKAAEAQRRLMYFADPLQDDPIARQNYREVLRKKTLLINNEREMLTEDLASARSQFDARDQTRIRRDFILFLCVLVPAVMLTLGAIYRAPRHIDESAGQP